MAEKCRDETNERIERQRAFLKQLQDDLIEEQSRRADLDEKLILTEQHLVAAKSSWANSELEREQMVSQVMELEERLHEAELNRGG